ncbi:ABC transporter permease [Acidicapsa dinghuensis]|uniref:ABC transporter permease n=1 Tax=Acidicapsa dinghuensis TaxID=2218256 RepID=A0ABW1EKZ3_9BACT|nr:ABC transporter permease [Acidicapsa dinghuensis]
MAFQSTEVFQALRIFRRNPGFSAVTVAVLALGIGAATAIFTVFSALMLRPLALPHPEQLVELSGIYRNHARIVISYPMYQQLTQSQQVFSSLTGWSAGNTDNVDINGKLMLADVRVVTGNYYTTLGEHPYLGRLISASDQQGTQGLPVAVISYEFWHRRFAASTSAIGKSIHIEGKLFTIVGVAHPFSSGVSIGNVPDIVVPAGSSASYDLSSRGLLWINATGRLRPGVTLAQARIQIESFWPRLVEATVPTQIVGPRRQAFLSMGLRLDPASNGINVDLRETMQRPLRLLLGMVGLILLVVCINLASLTLARASARRHEVCTRIALGATPWQAVRQSVYESLILAATGAVIGLALAYEGSHLLVALMIRGAQSSVLLDLHPDWRILAFCALAALATGAIIGLVPAWRLSREHPAEVLHAGRGTLGTGAGWLGKLLIISQIAISLVLLQGAGLFLRSLSALEHFQPGFARNNLTELELAPQPESAKSPEPPSYRRELAEAITSHAEVSSAAFSSLPIPANGRGWKEAVLDANDASAKGGVQATLDDISPNYFQTLQIPLVAGRDFTLQDDAKHPRVVILDEQIAQQLFPNTDPIGKFVRFGVQPDLQHLQVVGVAQNARLIDIRDANSPVIFESALQTGVDAGGAQLLLRGSETAATQKAIEDTVQSFGREYVSSIRTFEQRNEDSLILEQMTAKLSSFFAAIALLVAAAGLFGLMSYAVTLRTREIGVRMALGSSRTGILRLILRQSLLLTLFGIALGIPCALFAGRFIAHMLFGLSASDPITLILASLTLIAAGLLAGYLPARRGTHIDPITALRQE